MDKSVFEQAPDIFYLVGRNDKTEVQADQRLGAGVDSLAADDAKPDLVAAQQADQPVEENPPCPQQPLSKSAPLA